MNKCRWAILAGILILSNHAWAGSGAYSNDTTDTLAVSQGSAVTARALNASTNWYNPAGLSFLEGQNASVTGLYEGVQFSLDSDLGKSIDSERGDYFIPSAFYSYNAGKWALGVGINSPYGLATEWDDSITNYVATKTELTQFNINPNLSYKLTEDLSLALGISYQTLEGEMGRMINQTYLNTYLNSVLTGGNNVILSPDATSRLEGDDTAWGWNAALMYKVDDTLQAGLSYRHKTKFDLEGEAKLSGLSG